MFRNPLTPALSQRERGPEKPLFVIALWLLLGIVMAVMPAAVLAEAKDETTESAVLLLRRSMDLDNEGRYHILLRALRQLGDPLLEPFFSELFQSDHSQLKVHGLLGLAECSADHKLPLVRLASIESPSVQAETISAAMDGELLSDEQAKEIYNWPGLDNAVKVLVAAPLIKIGQLPNRDALREAAKSDNIGRRAMAWLELLQVGEPKALEQIEKIDKSDDPKRDPVREMLLQTALRYEFDKIGPWALKLGADPGINPKLAVLALRTAMRFSTPGSAELWTQQLQSATDPSQRMRLALIALQISPWLDARLFDPLTKSDDPLIHQIGLTGAAVAAKGPVATQAVALVQMNHPIATNWAMSYVKRYASPADGAAILLAVVNTANGPPEKTRPDRLDDAVIATQLLEELHHDSAVKLLRPILADAQTDPEIAQAILLGLIRAHTTTPERVIAGLPPFNDPMTNNMALVLLAKHGVALTPDQMRDLALVVRGGARQDSIRIQAAWTYLKITNQTKQALAQVLAARE